MQHYPININNIYTINAGVYIFEKIRIFKLHTTITKPKIIVPYAHKCNINPLLSIKLLDIEYVGKKHIIDVYHNP
jgi:hypothetical protein